MSDTKPSISSNIYVAFKSLPFGLWSDKIQFYEANEKGIFALEVKERLDILHLYMEALDKVRESSKLLGIASEFIPLSLSSGVPVDIGLRYYEDALFWKANSLIRLIQYKEASHILQELIRMNPNEKKYKDKLLLCLFYDKPKWLQYSKALSILLFLITAAVILVEILIVKTFYYQYLELVEGVRIALFVLALSLVGIMEFVHFLLCRKKVEQV